MSTRKPLVYEDNYASSRVGSVHYFEDSLVNGLEVLSTHKTIKIIIPPIDSMPGESIIFTRRERTTRNRDGQYEIRSNKNYWTFGRIVALAYHMTDSIIERGWDCYQDKHFLWININDDKTEFTVGLC